MCPPVVVLYWKPIEGKVLAGINAIRGYLNKDPPGDA